MNKQVIRRFQAKNWSAIDDAIKCEQSRSSFQCHGKLINKPAHDLPENQ